MKTSRERTRVHNMHTGGIHLGPTEEGSDLKQNIGLTGNATNLVHVFHDIFTAWFEVSQEGGSVCDCLESIDIQINAHGVRNCNKMEDSVGGTTKNHGQYLWNEG